MSVERLEKAIIDGNADDAKQIAKELLEKGVPSPEIIAKGLTKGIREIGRMWDIGEVFLPEVLCSADAFNSVMELIKPSMEQSASEKLGTIIIGTVEGDIHYIGKNIVATMLESSGFEVIDIGEDISPQKFCNAIVASKPDIVAMSCLISTSLIAMEETINQINKQGLHEGIIVMIGGPPISKEYSERIGADLYAEDAFKAADVAVKAIGGNTK